MRNAFLGSNYIGVHVILRYLCWICVHAALPTPIVTEITGILVLQLLAALPMVCISFSETLALLILEFGKLIVVLGNSDTGRHPNLFTLLRQSELLGFFGTFVVDNFDRELTVLTAMQLELCFSQLFLHSL